MKPKPKRAPRRLEIGATAARSPAALAELTEGQIIDVHDRVERRARTRALDAVETACLDKTRAELSRRWDADVPGKPTRVLLAGAGAVADHRVPVGWVARTRRDRYVCELARRFPEAAAALARDHGPEGGTRAVIDAVEDALRAPG